jgi:cation diffusion facilitator family transporter
MAAAGPVAAEPDDAAAAARPGAPSPAGGSPAGDSPAGDSPAGGSPAGGGEPSGGKAVIAALASNLGIAATKFIAFAITGSASMLAESVHSVADSGNQVLLLIGRRRARQEETEKHQFGYGAERYFYAFIVAVVFFIVGALFSIYQGIERITHPHQVTSPVWDFAVLGIALVLESLSIRTAIIESNHARGPSGWRSFIRHTKAPELPAVLLEDSAALVGLVLALLGIALSAITGNSIWDGAGSLAIGVLLGIVAVILAVEIKSLLIGESASKAAEQQIVTAIEAGPDIQGVIHLRTLHVGPETLLVAAKIAVRPEDSAARIVAVINAAERRIRTAVPIAKLIFLEPDLYQPARLDVADPAVRAVQRSSLLLAARRSAMRAVRRGRPKEPPAGRPK